MEFTVKTTGFKELEDVLIQMAEDVGYDKPQRNILIPATKAAMQPVLERARQTIPYDESNTQGPHMRDSLRLTAKRPNARDYRSIYVNKNAVAIADVSIKTDGRGMSQEFGNARTQAQPFLRLALETQIDRVISILGTFLTYKLSQYKSKKV